MSDLGEAVKETGRGLVQAGVNVANIPASVADAVTSAAAWAGGKLGIGDGTYQPAPRVTTQGLEQDFGLQQGALTPQTTEGRVFAEALPYLTPAGVERAATQAPTLAGRIAQGATRLLAENAVGSLAANSVKDDAEALATDLGVGVLAGGAINAAGRGLGAAYRGVRGYLGGYCAGAVHLHYYVYCPADEYFLGCPCWCVPWSADLGFVQLTYLERRGMGKLLCGRGPYRVKHVHRIHCLAH